MPSAPIRCSASARVTAAASANAECCTAASPATKACSGKRSSRGRPLRGLAEVTAAAWEAALATPGVPLVPPGEGGQRVPRDGNNPRQDASPPPPLRHTAINCMSLQMLSVRTLNAMHGQDRLLETRGPALVVMVPSPEIAAPCDPCRPLLAWLRNCYKRRALLRCRTHNRCRGAAVPRPVSENDTKVGCAELRQRSSSASPNYLN